MSFITTPASTETERQRIQQIIAEHEKDRPTGVRRIGFSFSEDHTGHPAVYLDLFIDKHLKPTKEYIEELNDYIQLIIDDILKEDVDYWPYARTLEEE